MELRLGDVPFDVGRDRVAVVRPPGGEEGLHLLVRDERDEEVEIVGSRPADRDHYAGSSLGAARRRIVSRSPEPSATPSRISARPRIIATVTGSERKTAP